MVDKDVPEPLHVLLIKLSVAIEEEDKARARVYMLKSRVHGPLGLFRRACNHSRVLHVRSDPYTTEANDFHWGDYIVVCHDPRRICLDCGHVERAQLAERFTDNCPRELRIRVKKEGEREEVLKRRSVAADRSARFHTLTTKPKRRIDAEQMEEIVGQHPSNLANTYLEGEDLYALWLKYGQPDMVAQPPKE
ncbi:MAG: hypothetical protein U9Q03_03165 [Patescibacteria group bacterium]|nr:hypothetical protein [Patescibacteria group bacterium]